MRRTLIFSLILLVSLVALVVAYFARRSNPTSAKRERVELTARSESTTAQQDIARSRKGEQRILSDLREAWTWPIGETVEVTFPVDETGPLELFLGVAGLDRTQPVSAARLRFEVVALAQTALAIDVELGLEDAASEWHRAVRMSEAPAGLTGFQLSAQWIGAAPAGASGLRAALALPSSARGRPRVAPDRPNVLIISIDTLRADRLGCYGYSRPTTRNIDALAARGTLFENATSAAPWTLPSYATLFTSRLPSEHRAGIVTEREELWGKDDRPPARLTTTLLRPDLPTMAGLFAHAGWRTAGFHANPYLSAASGVARGFDRYVRYETNANAGVGLAAEVLMGPQESAASRFLLFLHLMDPHWPYAPPAPFDERFAGRSIESLEGWPPGLDELRAHEPDPAMKRLLSDLYDAEIAFVDQQLVELLTWVEVIDSRNPSGTIIVLHSDHGEEFWEHGSCDHGHSQHAELLHVPLIICWPGHVPAGKRIATRVRTLDVLPTLLELCGVPAPDSLQGSSLVPLWNDKDLVDRDALSEAVQRGPREIKALASGQDKLIASGADSNRLFDLTADPNEEHDTSGANAARVAELRARIAVQHAKAAKIAAQPAIPIDAMSAEELRKLGYTGTEPPK